MASTTQNGWTKDPSVVRIYAGGDVDGAEVRSGDVAIVAQEFLNRFHQRVETIKQVNGYRSAAFNDSLPGSIKSSNHVSATAWDVNGSQHPNEITHPRNWTSGFTVAETAATRQLLAEFGGLIEWGMDFPKGTRDPMHFAIARGVTSSQIAALAKKLKPASPLPIYPVPDSISEDDMPIFMRSTNTTIYVIVPGKGKRGLNVQEWALWVRLGATTPGGDYLEAEIDIIANTMGG